MNEEIWLARYGRCAVLLIPARLVMTNLREHYHRVIYGAVGG